jgi:hypothetical protein
MADSPEIGFISSEKRTLEHVAVGEHHTSELDWVALQRLRVWGLVEERSTGMAITEAGRRVLQRLTVEALKPRRS